MHTLTQPCCHTCVPTCTPWHTHGHVCTYTVVLTHVHPHTLTCTYTHCHMHIQTHSLMHVCTWVFICTCSHAITHVHLHVGICTYLGTRVLSCMAMLSHTHMCALTCMRTRAHIPCCGDNTQAMSDFVLCCDCSLCGHEDQGGCHRHRVTEPLSEAQSSGLPTRAAAPSCTFSGHDACHPPSGSAATSRQRHLLRSHRALVCSCTMLPGVTGWDSSPQMTDEEVTSP